VSGVGEGPGTAPAGWYPDGSGQLRWWTGEVWGVFAPQQPPAPWGYAPAPRADANTLAMLAQLGQLVGGFIVPLVLYLTTGKDDPFVRHHSAEALNFSITYAIASFGLVAALFVGFVFPPAFIAFFLGIFVLIIGHLVFVLMAGVAAYRGQWWRYPVCFRLVPGSVEGRR
jgi:uncharacterized Tic20 family protein